MQLGLVFGFMLLAECFSQDYADRLRLESNYLYIKYDSASKGERPGFHQRVDLSVIENVAPVDCSKVNEYCLKWADYAKFQIKKKDDKCDDYRYVSKLDKTLKVRFDTTGVFLFGGFEQDHQSWPTDYSKFEKHAFVSSEYNSQAILEPFWLVSNGMYLYVDKKTPLFITQDKNKKTFEIIAERSAPYVRGELTELIYTVCKFNDMKEAYYHAVDNYLGKPLALPDTTMVKYPIWSTWAKYKADINSTVVLEFADMIIQSKLPNSQLEIDDAWETCYGSLTVDKGRFPDMNKTVQRLKTMGFRVTIWIHPFINLDCQPFHRDAQDKGYLVKNATGVVTSWWNGKKASYIDFTNPEAVTWFQTRLKNLKSETGIHSFKFDAGESSWSPRLPIFKVPSEDYPENILKSYIQAVSFFGNMVEVRSARGTQQYPIFVRMIDRETNWEKRLGLWTLIPATLHINMIGYPFVLPDMIGGNGYGKDVVTIEMFIRWLQINVFMPCIQFSMPPWDFGDAVLKVTKKFVDLHVKHSDKIIEAMQKAVTTGTPVNPPIWWIDPTDPQTYEIDSEFLLGEDLLIAPVIQEGARSRDIYLPKGNWKDELNTDAKIIEGPIWLYDYPADLNELPHFSKVTVHVDNSSTKNKVFNDATLVMPTMISVPLTFILMKLYNLWLF